MDRREIELKDGATYAFDLANGMSVAWDCQKEAGAAPRITFDAAKDNIVSLMVKRDGGGGSGGCGNLIVREEIAVPEFDRSHTDNHSTWALRIGGGQSENGVDLQTETHATNGTLEEQYEAVGVGKVDVRVAEGNESQDEALENKLVEEQLEQTEAEVAVSYEDQATLKIRQTPPPPLPPKRNGRRIGENEAETGEEGYVRLHPQSTLRFITDTL